MQTREHWHEKIKNRMTVEGQHHQCGAAQLGWGVTVSTRAYNNNSASKYQHWGPFRSTCNTRKISELVDVCKIVRCQQEARCSTTALFCWNKKCLVVERWQKLCRSFMVVEAVVQDFTKVTNELMSRLSWGFFNFWQGTWHLKIPANEWETEDVENGA